MLSAQTAPLDAARLDIMPPELWGRAESIRTVIRSFAQALAPLLFGVISDHVFGGGRSGLQQTFLLMLLPLAASAALLYRALRTYPRDVATAAATASAQLRRSAKRRIALSAERRSGPARGWSTDGIDAAPLQLRRGQPVDVTKPRVPGMEQPQSPQTAAITRRQHAQRDIETEHRWATRVFPRRSLSAMAAARAVTSSPSRGGLRRDLMSSR